MLQRAKPNELIKVATLIASLFCVGAAINLASTQQPPILNAKTVIMQAPDFTSNWKSGGLDHRVSTYIADGETKAAAAQRHKEKVDALLSVYPKDPEPVE